MSSVPYVWGSFNFSRNGNISRKQCVTAVVNAWKTCGVRESCLGLRYRGIRPTPVPVGKLRLYWIIWISLEPRARHTCDHVKEANSLLYRTGSHILPYRVLLLILRATRAPCRSRTRPPSNLGIAVSADNSTFEYERHSACLSVKPSTDELSHVPLHARSLRCAAFRVDEPPFQALSAQATCRGFRGLMEAPNWY